MSHPLLQEQPSLPHIPLLLHSALLLQDSTENKLLFVVKEIKMILRLFLVIAMYCQGSSSQIKSITQPLPLLAGWKGSLGTCSR
jgi:hypothetical protein